MAIPEEEKLTVDEFFEAIAGREGRYELVGGVAYAMAGAKEGHNVICSNVQTAFVPAGKRKGCRTTSSNTAVRTGPDTVRYPDVVVDCGPPDATALTASRPTIVVGFFVRRRRLRVRHQIARIPGRGKRRHGPADRVGNRPRQSSQTARRRNLSEEDRGVRHGYPFSFAGGVHDAQRNLRYAEPATSTTPPGCQERTQLGPGQLDFAVGRSRGPDESEIGL